ncbi:MAG: c-type cytochrome [Novosphingobium sp.]|uniref:c-type cytochrome n=1 Tax=Novosphingobium sp. TaxID=1874826 RepID=UPI003B9ACF3F
MKRGTVILNATAAFALGSIAANALAQSAAEASGPAASAFLQPGDADGAFVNARQFSEPDGERLYRRVCAGCHMSDARGANGAGTYPALAANPNLASGDYAVFVVLKGLHGMPGVGRMMTDDQVADVVNYVRTHFGNKYRDRVTAAQVKSVR